MTIFPYPEDVSVKLEELKSQLKDTKKKLSTNKRKKKQLQSDRPIKKQSTCVEYIQISQQKVGLIIMGEQLIADKKTVSVWQPGTIL